MIILITRRTHPLIQVLNQITRSRRDNCFDLIRRHEDGTDVSQPRKGSESNLGYIGTGPPCTLNTAPALRHVRNHIVVPSLIIGEMKAIFMHICFHGPENIQVFTEYVSSMCPPH